MISRRPLLLVLVGMLCLPASVLAQNNNRRVVPLTRKGAASELPTVGRVSGDTVTIGKKTYKVTDFTKITINGKKGSVGDLKSGMQASVTGGVLKYGKGKADTIYKATRIVAKADNKLEEKRKDFNKKQAERARKLNQQRGRNRNRR